MVKVGAQDDLVVNVGDILDVEHVEAKVVHQHAPHDVERHVVARVADVGCIVDRRPTHIPFDEARVEGHEGLHLLRERI